MLKLSAYLPSVENHDDMPSPLMDGDAVPAVVAPIAEINQDVLPGDDLGAVQVVEDLSSLPVEELVELPPHLDPTPMQPLEGEVIQEELIAENLDTEAGQLLGAQIAMEGYSTLLRSAGKNMTRQSAAFMAVGMRRASRLLPGVTLGMEDETSGTQVMAMQQAKVDEKGLGSKIAEAAGKIWEWLKQKFAKLKELAQSLFKRKQKEDTSKEIVYLLAASKAVESGKPGSVKGVEAPGGLRTSQVLDAIHGEDVRAPKAGKTVKLPAKFAQFLTKDGKLDLNLTVENEMRTKVLIDYLKSGTAFAKGVAQIFRDNGKSLTAEMLGDLLSDLKKKTLATTAKTWDLHGMRVAISADGLMTMEELPADGDIEVQVPSPQEIRRYLEDIEKVLNSDIPAGEAVAREFLAAGEEIMRLGGIAEDQIPKDEMPGIERVLMQTMNGSTFDSAMLKVGNHMDKMSTVATKACDFFLAALLGKDNTISQEDFERLPSKGLSVVQQPRGPGMGARLVAGAQQAWQKIKAFFAKLWQQFSDWAKNLWARLTGTEQQTDVLLLTNAAVPEDGRPAGDVAALPQGTRLKSVQAARMLGGPSAPTEAPVEAVVEPMAAAAPSLPAGMVFVPEAAQIMVGNALQIDPVWEEEMTNWLIRHYIPTQEKIVRDLISFAGSYTFDGGIMGYKPIVDKMVPQLFQGMPSTPVPGQRTITPGEGCKLKVSQEGMMGETQPVAIVKKRPLDQALARQKKLLRALSGLEKTRLVTERQRGQLNTILDRRVSEGVAEADVTAFYNYMERVVMVSSAAVVANVIAKMCDARVAVADAMIVARAQGKK